MSHPYVTGVYLTNLLKLQHFILWTLTHFLGCTSRYLIQNFSSKTMMHTCSMCWFTKPFHPNIQYEYLILGANNSRSKNTASGGYSNVFIFPMYSGKNIATEHLYGWLSCDINARCVQNPLSLYFTGWSDKNSHIHNNPWYSMWIQYNAPIINQPSSINYKINEMNHHLLNDCIQLPSNTYYLFLPWPVSGLDCELPQTLYIYIHLYTFI